ncbi:MAG: hypothetical protein ABIS36_04535 [Chryseolinea sp.]
MSNLVKLGKAFYSSSMAGIGLHQLFYAEFNNMMMPPWPIDNTGYTVLAYAGNLALILAGIKMFSTTKARITALILGATFLFLCLLSYALYELILDPYSHHLPLWTNALKELAFAGGAFVLAGTSRAPASETNSTILKGLEKFIPYGHAFFCITMISFGLMHLLYLEHVSKLVPAWIPFPVFWTALAGIALIGSGLCIVAKIKLRLVSNLLALMIFIWLLILHIPRAVSTPLLDHGNQVTSAFSALIFVGIALMIGNSPPETSRMKSDA